MQVRYWAVRETKLNMIQVTPVILCGGSGTRLWPLSRTGFPKQFLCITGVDSLFQQAAQRLVGLGSNFIQVASPIIVTGEEHRFLAIEQLREAGISLGAVLLEPFGRNTAPALTLAALAAIENGEDPVLVVSSADQTIADSDVFTANTQCAVEQATHGGIVILGVTPTYPETGYGYIRVKTQGNNNADQIAVYKVQKFVEKPNEDTAQQYVNEGDYFWNAGIFVLKASVWLKAIKLYRSDIYEATILAWEARCSDQNSAMPFVRPGKKEFSVIPAESVDRAVIERCPESAFPIHMVKLNSGWNDLGAWEAVWNALPKDEHGNANVGDVLMTHSHNSLVHASSRLVGLVGVSDLIVVETSDAVLVTNKANSQDVKHIVAQLQKIGREEYTLHRKTHRPWGWYDSVDEGERFKVKRIQVKPGASISLQKHDHRAEHWIVVKGTAEIMISDKVLTLTENQSTYIPLGAVHRLTNPGVIALEIIEVQTGSYLGEDDIVRFEDDYGR